MEISIISGIYSDFSPEYRAAYPKNLMPIGLQSGISSSYLKTMKGVEEFVETDGVDRGGIVWDGVHYRVIGDQLCTVDSLGVITELGSVGSDGKKVTLDYSFDRLAIRSGLNLYYWHDSAISQVTDVDLGDVFDFAFIDGYFMTTDGEFIVVTELGDPTQVDPAKYGASEVDPDPVLGVIRIAGEIFTLNRYTIEAFENIGGSGFPFSRIDGATISKGIIGTQAKCTAADTLFFVGSGRGEELGMYVGGSGRADKVSTAEIDKILNSLTEAQQEAIELESRVMDGVEFVYVHTAIGTYCYSITSTLILKQPVWFSLHSNSAATGKYWLRNWVLAYNEWVCGDTNSNRLGKEIDSPKHFDTEVGWEFSTSFIYNKGNGAIVNEIELVGLPGSTPLGSEAPSIFHSYSNDGKVWSVEKSKSAGVRGNYQKRILWMILGMLRNFRCFKFRCVSDTPFSFSTIQAKLEPLNA